MTDKDSAGIVTEGAATDRFVTRAEFVSFMRVLCHILFCLKAWMFGIAQGCTDSRQRALWMTGGSFPAALHRWLTKRYPAPCRK